MTLTNDAVEGSVASVCKLLLVAGVLFGGFATPASAAGSGQPVDTSADDPYGTFGRAGPEHIDEMSLAMTHGEGIHGRGAPDQLEALSRTPSEVTAHGNSPSRYAEEMSLVMVPGGIVPGKGAPEHIDEM